MTPKERKSSRKKAHSRRKGSRKWLYVAIPVLAAVLIGGGWFLARQGDAGSTGSEVRLASVSQLPERVRSAPPVVQEAYRFAIANPEVLARLPCYCGCGGEGHKSNLDCFVQGFNSDGSAVFDYHAFG